MSELSFLLDILLNHQLQKPTKDAIRDRIREVEAGLVAGVIAAPAPRPQPAAANPRAQSPSTMALLAKHPDLVGGGGEIPAPACVPDPVVPVAVIAQTPAAAQAMALRNQSIQQAMSGRPEQGRTSPRKF